MICYRLKNKGKSVIVTETELTNIYQQFHRVWANKRPVLLKDQGEPRSGELEKVNLLPVTAIKKFSENHLPIAQRKKR